MFLFITKRYDLVYIISNTEFPTNTPLYTCLFRKTTFYYPLTKGGFVLLVHFLHQYFPIWPGELDKFHSPCINTNCDAWYQFVFPRSGSTALDGTSVAPQLGERTPVLLPLFKSTPFNFTKGLTKTCIRD